MQTQLLFFDIDGTLLSNYTHQIPDSAIEAIHQAQANGHLCFINTGRTTSTMPDEFRHLGFDGFLYGCGTRITLHDQTLMAHSFTKEYGIELIDRMDAMNLEFFLEGSDDIYCKRSSYRQPSLNQTREYFHSLGLGLSNFIEDKNFIYDKFIIVSDNPTNSDAFIESVRDKIDAIDRGEGMYECVPLGYSKATAMEYLAKHMGISMEHTWAFGDSSNDLPMFKAAAHCVAMGEHSPVLDPYAEFVTDTVENDGIAHALQRAGLI